GSCNWLSSGFNRVEASMRIIDLRISSIALSIASTLAMGQRGLANDLSRDLAVQSARLNVLAKPQQGKKLTDPVSVKLLTAPEHHKIAKCASDEAEREIFVCSHRVSYAGDRPIF